MYSASGIYQIKNKATGKVYVGSAVHVCRRWALHKRQLRKGAHHSAKLQNAWNKYGEASFELTMLEVVQDLSRLCEREQYWIDLLQSARDGMNMSPTAGSILGAKFSEESKRRMSAAAKGKKKTSQHVEKVRQALIGRTMTLEQRQKMRQARLGRTFGARSAETGAKISAANKGRQFTPEHREKLAAAKRGRKLSPEHIASLVAGHKARAERLKAVAANQVAL